MIEVGPLLLVEHLVGTALFGLGRRTRRFAGGSLPSLFHLARRLLDYDGLSRLVQCDSQLVDDPGLRQDVIECGGLFGIERRTECFQLAPKLAPCLGTLRMHLRKVGAGQRVADRRGHRADELQIVRVLVVGEGRLHRGGNLVAGRQLRDRNRRLVMRRLIQRLDGVVPVFVPFEVEQGIANVVGHHTADAHG